MATSRKILIILALVVLICVLYFFLIYQGKQDEISKTQTLLSELTQQYQEVKAASEGLQSIKVEINKLDQRLTESLAQLPEQKKIESILRSFEDLALSAGLELATITPNPEAPRDFYSEIPIELEITGAYHNIALFFDKVSRLKRVINVSGLRLSDPTEKNGEILISANCIATAFRFRQVTESLGGAEAEKKN